MTPVRAGGRPGRPSAPAGTLGAMTSEATTPEQTRPADGGAAAEAWSAPVARTPFAPPCGTPPRAGALASAALPPFLLVFFVMGPRYPP